MKYRYLNKRIQNLLLLVVIVSFVFIGCKEDCLDCKTSILKHLRVLDTSGNSIFYKYEYGDNGINLNNTGQYERFDSNAQVIWFELRSDISNYILRLDTKNIDTISFSTFEEDDPKCCGTITFPSNTFLNGEQIDNKDTIVIVVEE